MLTKNMHDFSVPVAVKEGACAGYHDSVWELTGCTQCNRQFRVKPVIRSSADWERMTGRMLSWDHN